MQSIPTNPAYNARPIRANKPAESMTTPYSCPILTAAAAFVVLGVADADPDVPDAATVGPAVVADEDVVAAPATAA